MKAYFSIIILLSLITNVCLAQITVEDLRQIKNTPQFKGGEQELSKHIKMSIRYPMALINKPESCSILGFIKISKKGKIVEAGTLNKAPQPFVTEFVRVAKLTAGKWKTSDDNLNYFYVVIPIEFSYAGAKHHTNFENVPKFFKEPTVVVAYSKESPKDYTPDSRYVEKVIALTSEKKYSEAIEVMELLLCRQLLNPDYYSMLIDLYTKSGIKDQAEFYSTLLEIINNKG